MPVLKNFIKEILSIFVYFRFPTIKDMYEYLIKHNKKSGLVATIFSYQLEKKNSFIGIGAKFKNWPYFTHGYSNIQISPRVSIGKNAVIFQDVIIGGVTTYGSKNNGAPSIGDNAYICAGARLIGKINIGNNVRIGAGAIVYKDVPDNCVVVGDCKIIQKEEPLDNRYFIVEGDKVFVYDFDERKYKEFKENI